jgi:adenylate cyclase
MNALLGTGAARRNIALALVAAMLVAAAIALPRYFLPAELVESWVLDIRVASLTPPETKHDDIIILGINESTMAQEVMHYRSPKDREQLALWIAAADRAGARAIGVDILFDQSTEPDKDDLLQQTIQNATTPVIVGWADASSGLTSRQLEFQASYTSSMSTGHVLLGKDKFGTIRWIEAPVRDVTDGEPVLRLPFVSAIAESLGVSTPRERFSIDYRGPALDASSGFTEYPAQWSTKLNPDTLAERIVLIGTLLPDEDRHHTPLSTAPGTQPDLPGITIHAHALAQLLDGRHVLHSGELLDGTIATILVLIAMAIAFWGGPAPVRLGLLSVVAVVLWVGGFVLYGNGGPLIPLVVPTLVMGTAYGITSATIGARLRKEKREIRRVLRHYVAPAVIRNLEADPKRLRLGGERREVTYIFTDVANFTPLSEKMAPEKLVPLLNAYLDGMYKILIAHECTLDKFIGDAVMAVLGAPDDQPDHAQRAVICALDLDTFAQGFASEKVAAGIAFGGTRIGVHTGPAVVGNIGGSGHFDYTAIGDTVNTAARLESANKFLGTRICISAATAERCNEVALRPIGDLVIRGKTEAVRVFEPLSPARAVMPAVLAYRAAFEKLTFDDPTATEAFEKLVAAHPDDALAAFHRTRLIAGERGTLLKWSPG